MVRTNSEQNQSSAQRPELQPVHRPEIEIWVRKGLTVLCSVWGSSLLVACLRLDQNLCHRSTGLTSQPDFSRVASGVLGHVVLGPLFWTLWFWAELEQSSDVLHHVCVMRRRFSLQLLSLISASSLSAGRVLHILLWLDGSTAAT